MRLFRTGLSSSGGVIPPPTKSDINFCAMGDPQHDINNANVLRAPRQWQVRDSVVHWDTNYPDDSFLLQVGDYMDDNIIDNPDSYGQMNSIFNLTSRDKYRVIGNHDVRMPPSNYTGDISAFDAATATVFKYIDPTPDTGYGYEQREDNGLHIIILNNCEAFSYSFTDGQYKISQTQLDWFQATLDSITESEARVLVTIHAPLKCEEFNGADPNLRLHDQTQADEILDMLLAWQKASDRGLVLSVLAGHTHVDDRQTYTTVNGSIDNITLDENRTDNSTYDGVQDIAGPAGTNTAWMAYGRFNFNETTKFLTVTGYGEQDNYSIDMIDRITPPGI